jgi:hypothetical protein
MVIGLIALQMQHSRHVHCADGTRIARHGSVTCSSLD